MPYFDVPLRQPSTPRRRPVSVMALNGELVGAFSNSVCCILYLIIHSSNEDRPLIYQTSVCNVSEPE